jgi:hypothetical protein
MGDWLSDLDPRVALGAVILALVSGVARAFGEVLFGELKLWLKEKMRPRRKRTDLTPSCGPRN